LNVDIHRDRVLALAGMFQATSLVSQVARNGLVDTAPYTASIQSILAIDAESVEAIYGGLAGLEQGLRILGSEFGRQAPARGTDITRYVINLMHLERKLVRRPALLKAIREGIEAANTQAEHFSVTHTNVIARLADVYTRTVSTLGPRIMVRGEPVYLNNPDNANRIRALLLAGIRSAVLWRQRGGTRLNLLTSRRRIVATAQELRDTLIGTGA